MILRLALRNLILRPWRSAFLLFGFSLGVGVMIVLLSIGAAMLTQASDEKLVGGGEITVLPEGIDIEVLKTGGVGGLFYSIPNARFVDLQLLSSPRLASSIAAVAPQIDGKLLYARLADGREIPVRATGEIPSASRAAGGLPELAAGVWQDDRFDRRLRTPTAYELRHQIDRFHLPPDDAARRETWGEWHYFNVLTDDRRRWAFVTLAVGGDIPNGEWGGQVLITTHGDARPDRRFVATAMPANVRFSTHDADLRVGRSSVTVLPDGRYHVVAEAPEERGAGIASVDLIVSPADRAYFPGVNLGGDDLVSGYVVPALRATATGTLCVDGQCEQLRGVQSYHDHNWGIWSRVDWEWGAVQAGDLGVLYGRVNPPDDVADPPPLLLYVTDSLGFVALFRPTAVTYVEGGTTMVDGRRVPVPSRAILADARGADTVRLELDVEHATATDTRRGLLQRGDTLAARGLDRPYFIQMKGTAHITGRVRGRRLDVRGSAFFETYR